MRISELADEAGVTTSAIRYYEPIGLLPGPARSDSATAAMTTMPSPA